MDKRRLTLLQPEMRPKPIPDVGFSYPVSLEKKV